MAKFVLGNYLTRPFRRECVGNPFQNMRLSWAIVESCLREIMSNFIWRSSSTIECMSRIVCQRQFDLTWCRTKLWARLSQAKPNKCGFRRICFKIELIEVLDVLLSSMNFSILSYLFTFSSKQSHVIYVRVAMSQNCLLTIKEQRTEYGDFWDLKLSWLYIIWNVYEQHCYSDTSF